MTPEQEAHLEDIILSVLSRLSPKYRQGCNTHGGTLLDMDELQLVDEAIDEALDQITYLITLRMKLSKEAV